MNTIDITLSRSVAATPEQVFDVWLDPNSPGGPWYGAQRTILHPVPDGLFYHCVGHEGRSWAHYGRFVRLDRPGLIEHTWVSEATQGIETFLTLTFAPHGAETLVTLRHAKVPDDAMGRRHEEGWTYTLNALATRFAKR